MANNPIDALSGVGKGGASSGGYAAQALVEAQDPVAQAQTRSADPRQDIRSDKIELSAQALIAAAQAGLKDAFGKDLPQDRPADMQSYNPVNLNIQFNFNKELGILEATVIDAKTHKILRQVPPQDVLELQSRIHQYAKSRAERAQSGDPTVRTEAAGKAPGEEDAPGDQATDQASGEQAA